MTRKIFALVACVGLMGCGADGEPVQPTANLGVSVSNSGVHTGARVGVSKGPLSINWNIFD
ncbi:MAG: hypothetical protein ABJL99_08415 [Aliishimia sp.]